MEVRGRVGPEAALGTARKAKGEKGRTGNYVSATANPKDGLAFNQPFPAVTFMI